MPKVSHEVLLKRAAEKHAGKYSYGPILKNPDRSGSIFTIICPVHGEFLQPVDRHLRGAGCKKCAMTVNIAKQRHTLDSVRESTAKYGFTYEYVELKYYNGEKAPDVVYNCKVHGQVIQNLYNHLQGKGCAECSRLNKRSDFEAFVKAAREKHGLTYEYKDFSYEPMYGIHKPVVTVVCPDHGSWRQKAELHLLGHGCKDCGETLKGLRSRLPDSLIFSRLLGRDEYTPVEILRSEEFSSFRVKSLCAEHGEFVQTGYNRLKGQKCPSCANLTSKPCRDIAAWLTECGIEYEMEARLGTTKHAWDFAFHSKNLALEYHGVHWHSSKYCESGEIKKKHDLGLANGYRTIHIYEDEWLFNQALVKRHLLNALGVSKEISLYARKLKTVTVPTADAKRFLTDNHIQGFVPASLYVGLVSDAGELAAIMGIAMRPPGRGATISAETAELVRYATSCKVSGGMGKLLSFAQRLLGFSRIVTFSEVRLHHGGSYAALGFVQTARIPPDYMYVVNNRRVHKSGFQKTKLVKKGYTVDFTKTERELTEALGFYRIYDAGKLRWEKSYT